MILELEKYSDKNFLDKLFNKNFEEVLILEHQKSIKNFRIESFDTYNFFLEKLNLDKNIFYENQRIIRNILDPKDSIIGYLDINNSNIDFVNLHPLPIEIQSISNFNFNKKIDNFIINSPNYNFLSNKNKINYKSLKIEIKYFENKDYLKIE